MGYLTIINIEKIKEEKGEDQEEETKEEKKKKKTVNLTVKVVDQKDNPVKGAKVTVFSNPKTATTNSKGEVIFKNLEKGEHKLVVSHDGYTGNQKLALNEDNIKTYVVTVKMEKTISGNTFLPILALVGLSFLIFCFPNKIMRFFNGAPGKRKNKTEEFSKN